MALSAAVVWETRTSGSDNSGGGFKAGASGTDRSQQDAAQVVIDNATITTSITTNVITFTAGYTPTAADVGNVVQMLTGTNVTAGFYEITGQTSTTWTVDRNVVTSGTTTNATGNMGGALASPGKAAGARVGGNTVYVKAGTYTCSATSNVSGGNVNDATANGSTTPGKWLGYSTTRGDGGKATLDAGAATMTIFTVSAQYTYVENFNFTNSAARASVIGATIGGTYTIIRSCKISGATGSAGLQMSSGTNGIRAFDCEVTGCNSTNAALYVASNSCYVSRCNVHGNTGRGLYFNSAVENVASDCLAYGNTSHGFSSGTTTYASFLNCTAYGNTGAGIDGFNLSVTSDCTNCISYGNGGYGFNLTTAGAGQLARLFNCAGGGNTTGNYESSIAVTDNFKALTGDPFTSSAGNDFSLNNTAGAGAACRAAGVPAAIAGSSTTSYPDIGAAQVQATSGDTGSLSRYNQGFN